MGTRFVAKVTTNYHYDLARACMCTTDRSDSPILDSNAIDAWNGSTIEFGLNVAGKSEELDAGHYWPPATVQDITGTVRIHLTCEDKCDKRAAPGALANSNRRKGPEHEPKPYSQIHTEWIPT